MLRYGTGGIFLSGIPPGGQKSWPRGRPSVVRHTCGPPCMWSISMVLQDSDLHAEPSGRPRAPGPLVFVFVLLLFSPSAPPYPPGPPTDRELKNSPPRAADLSASGAPRESSDHSGWQAPSSRRTPMPQRALRSRFARHCRHSLQSSCRVLKLLY